MVFFHADTYISLVRYILGLSVKVSAAAVSADFFCPISSENGTMEYRGTSAGTMGLDPENEKLTDFGALGMRVAGGGISARRPPGAAVGRAVVPGVDFLFPRTIENKKTKRNKAMGTAYNTIFRFIPVLIRCNSRARRTPVSAA